MFKTSSLILMLVALLGHGLEAHAAAEDDLFPADELIFNDELPVQTKIQQGGTCSLFASAALVEAACYRRTGKHVDISEAALYVQDLDRLLLDPFERRSLIGDHGSITGMEGDGGSIWAINHLIKGLDCFNGSNIPMDQGFVDQIENIMQVYGKEEVEKIQQAQNQFKDGSPDKLERLVYDTSRGVRVAADDMLRFNFDSMIGSTGSDPDIAACLKGPKMDVEYVNPGSDVPGHRMNAGTRSSAELLEQQMRKQNVPILCEENMEYKFPNGATVSGFHAFMLLGVHTGSSGQKEFLVRDSNIDHEYWLPLSGCQNAWYIK